MTSPKITDVQAAEGSRLTIRWEDGSTSEHDLAPVIAAKQWAAPLRDPAVFSRVVVTQDGHEVTWPGTGIDFSADGLWEDIHPPQVPAAKWMSAAQFRAWLTEMGFTWDAAAQALNVVRNTVGNYLAGRQEIPKTVWLACMQLAEQKHRAAVSAPSTHTVVVPNARITLKTQGVNTIISKTFISSWESTRTPNIYNTEIGPVPRVRAVA